jgi:hypothetical protein
VACELYRVPVTDAYDHPRLGANFCRCNLAYGLKNNLHFLHQLVLVAVLDGVLFRTCMTDEVSSVGCAVAENQMGGSDALQPDGLSSQKVTQVNHKLVLCKSFFNG